MHYWSCRKKHTFRFTMVKERYVTIIPPSRKRFVDVSLRRGLPTVLFVQAYEKVIVEAQTTHVYDEATIVEQVVENNVNEVNEIGDDDQAEGSQPVREPRGEVDEGEHIPGLVERMRREDTEGDIDNDDDRPVQVPSQWNNYDHSQLLVNEGETVPWEYGENEVSVGAISKEQVQRWAAKSLKKEFGVVKSSPQVYDVKCIRDDCPFRVHAYMGKYDTFSVGYEPKSIINSIDDDFQYKIKVLKLTGETKALEMRWGTYEASYHNLPRVPHTLCAPHKARSSACFLCIGGVHQCIPLPPSAMHRRNLLKGRYKGTMLTPLRQMDMARHNPEDSYGAVIHKE
ncbi:hypothetical protein U9M48_018594 [Paspalum notatum var. saurae]|uniref:Transposase MuDR plant domain-containing protein n=1 Tax=Paspalum notatum var. saurae TaxID=547442 RepID=A0AAQ3TDW3_PASNO